MTLNDPYYPPPEKMVTELVLDRVKVAARGYITRQALADRASAVVMLDHLADQLIVNLESFVLADDSKTVEWRLVEYRPTGWWDYLKRRHAPRWMLRRWPVKQTRHERILSLPVRSLYPEAPVEPRGLGPVVFHTIDPPAFEIRSQK